MKIFLTEQETELVRVVFKLFEQQLKALRYYDKKTFNSLLNKIEPELKTAECKWCKKDFTPTVNQQKYCSVQCVRKHEKFRCILKEVQEDHG